MWYQNKKYIPHTYAGTTRKKNPHFLIFTTSTPTSKMKIHQIHDKNY